MCSERKHWNWIRLEGQIKSSVSELQNLSYDIGVVLMLHMHFDIQIEYQKGNLVRG